MKRARTAGNQEGYKKVFSTKNNLFGFRSKIFTSAIDFANCFYCFLILLYAFFSLWLHLWFIWVSFSSSFIWGFESLTSMYQLRGLLLALALVRLKNLMLKMRMFIPLVSILWYILILVLYGPFFFLSTIVDFSEFLSFVLGWLS